MTRFKLSLVHRRRADRLQAAMQLVDVEKRQHGTFDVPLRREKRPRAQGIPAARLVAGLALDGGLHLQ